VSEEKEKSGEELILILLLCGLFGGYCLEYTLEFWISYLTNSCVDLGYFICILIGAVCYKNLADYFLLAALVTWLLSPIIL